MATLRIRACTRLNKSWRRAGAFETVLFVDEEGGTVFGARFPRGVRMLLICCLLEARMLGLGEMRRSCVP